MTTPTHISASATAPMTDMLSKPSTELAPHSRCAGPITALYSTLYTVLPTI